MDRSTTVILLSLALHLLVWWALRHLPSSPMNPPPSAPTEVTYVDAKERPRASKPQYVDPQPRRDDKGVVEEVHDTAALISNLNRRFKKQTLARRRGPEVNTPNPNLQPSLLDQKPVGRETEERRERSRERGEELMLPNSGAMRHAPAIGGSSTSMQIPWVDFGDLSVLNSDRNIYYAFYSRMNEQVGNRWGMLVREMISRTSVDRLREMSKQDRRTIVEIVLDAQGDFVRANFEKGSGFEDLDWTGVEAFRMATPFINPPKGMLAPDGLIHVHVAFEVLLRPPMMNY